MFILGSDGSGKMTVALRLMRFGFLLPKIFTTRQYKNTLEYISRRENYDL